MHTNTIMHVCVGGTWTLFPVSVVVPNVPLLATAALWPSDPKSRTSAAKPELLIKTLWENPLFELLVYAKLQKHSK